MCSLIKSPGQRFKIGAFVVHFHDAEFATLQDVPMATVTEMNVDPVSLVVDLEKCWQVREVDPQTWGLIVLRLVHLAGSILSEAAKSMNQANGPVQISAGQCSETMSASEQLQDSLELLLEKYDRPWQAEPRSADGIMQADQGMFRPFEGCVKTTLEYSLTGIDLVYEAGVLEVHYWMCQHCGRPTSEEYAEHMSKIHPQAALEQAPRPLHLNDMIRLVQATKKPATTVYSAESPIYRASNRATRHGREDRATFHKWRAYAYLLDCELRELPRFEGMVYRAVPCRLPVSLYSKGNVVTWNQPSSASEDPRIARRFLKSKGHWPTGTIFIIHSVTGRPIKEYSLHKEEKEVLFLTGTQFQVVNQADVGLKMLLEVAMRCNLSQVDVYEMRELVLDSWCDVEGYVDAAQSTHNNRLFDLIRQQPTNPCVLPGRNVVKECCVPMSSLLRSDDGSTALHLAAAVPNNLPCVQLVCSALQEGDDGARNGEGKTALEVAVDMGHKDTAVFLLQRFQGWRQLSQVQCCKALPWICAAGDKDLLEVLCKAADSMEGMQQGLLAACSQNQLDCIDTLVECHADVQQARADGWTALMSASQSGHAACIRRLVRHQADVGATRKGSFTALMSAAENGHVSCIQTLIKYKADLEAATDGGSTALHIASHYGQTSCVQALINHNADLRAAKKNGWTALMFAAQSGHASCIETLAIRKADVNQADHCGCTALTVAAKCGYASCVETLAGRNAALGAVDQHGRTALHMAVICGHAACVQVLIAHQADVGAADDAGQTALMDAAQNGDVECVTALLQHKADPGAVHRTGQTALMWAALGGYTACVEALLLHRADAGATNNGGWSALTAACCSGTAACVAALGTHCGDAPAPQDGGEAHSRDGVVVAADAGDGLAAACRHCGARVRVAAHGVYHNTLQYCCDMCNRTYAICGGVYHCSCGMDACRTCVGAGGLVVADVTASDKGRLHNGMDRISGGEGSSPSS